jgi:hypothetical protein
MSYISITDFTRDVREVTLWMNNGGRPAAAPPAMVTIYLGGELLGTVTVANGFAPYTLAVSSELSALAARSGEPVELRLLTTVWNPHDVIGSPDDRELGVMVDRVTVQ